MATHVISESTNRVMTTPREAHLAQDAFEALEGHDGKLLIDQGSDHVSTVPPEIGRILQEVLHVMANGGTVTIGAIPDELTTSAAAALLGVSRPTLMKLIRDEVLPSHRVGSHTRLKADDVLAERSARRGRQRAAFAALRELEDED